MTDRGTGRTTRMVEQIPECGATIIVHNTAMVDHVKHLVQKVHGENMVPKCTIVAIRDSYGIPRLRGLRGHLLVDHAFWEQRYPFARELEAVVGYYNSRTT